MGQVGLGPGFDAKICTASVIEVEVGNAYGVRYAEERKGKKERAMECFISSYGYSGCIRAALEGGGCPAHRVHSQYLFAGFLILIQ